MKKESKSKGAFFEGSSWYHRVKKMQPDGSVKYSKRGGFPSEAAALESLKKHNEEFLKEQRSMLIEQDSTSGNVIWLTDYLKWWFEECYSIRIESTTKMLGAYVLYDMIIPCIEEDIKLRYLNTDYLNALLERVSLITASAGNKARELLNIALKDAVNQGLLKNNPTEGTRTYPREKPKVRIYSKDKLRIFLKAASESDWYLEILLATFCGMRKGEILGLKFTDIDYDLKAVHIQRQITADYTVEKGGGISDCSWKEKLPKSEKSDRILRLPDIIVDEIRKREGVIAMNKDIWGSEYRDYGYISCQKNGLPHSLSAMNVALTKLCRRNGLETVSVHGLRHQYATILAEQGVPLVKISALLGHASIVTTYEYYVGQMDEEERIISFMNDRFTAGGEEEYDD